MTVRSPLLLILWMTFLESSFCLSCAIFPAVRVLRYCDSNIPAMDKLYHLAIVDLNNTELFGPLLLSDGLRMEENKIYGERMGASDT